ncbi:MAG: hypothetical protein ACOY93_05835 [Bacillota bacterium]
MNQVKEEAGSAGEDCGGWISRMLAERADWLMEQFGGRLLAHLERTGTAAASIESLYDPALARHLKQVLCPVEALYDRLNSLLRKHGILPISR